MPTSTPPLYLVLLCLSSVLAALWDFLILTPMKLPALVTCLLDSPLVSHFRKASVSPNFHPLWNDHTSKKTIQNLFPKYASPSLLSHPFYEDLDSIVLVSTH